MSDPDEGKGRWEAGDGEWYPPPPASVTQQSQPPMVQASARSSSSGCVIAAVIVGVVAVLGILFVVLVLVALAASVSWMYDQDDTEIEGDAVEAECLTSDDGFMAAEVEVTNNSPYPSRYLIDLVFEYPRSGDQLVSSSRSTAILRSGQSTTLEVVTGTEPPPGGFACEVADVARSASDP